MVAALSSGSTMWPLLGVLWCMEVVAARPSGPLGFYDEDCIESVHCCSMLDKSGAVFPEPIPQRLSHEQLVLGQLLSAQRHLHNCMLLSG